MNFSEAMNYIEIKSGLGIVPGLDNIKELLRRLGNPQDKIQCLHIAGTNGKGSIFAYIENVLIKAGYKVGRYISPTITDYMERFSINKRMMKEEQFPYYLEKVAEKISAMEEEGYSSPTAFEIETAIAYLYFSMENVDFALIECGMGGMEDATNVMKESLVSVMASVSMDHMQFLGDTLEDIARQKAGIIKENGLIISYPQDSVVENVLRATCEEKNADFIMLSEEDVEIIEENYNGTSFIYDSSNYNISLPGTYQIYNAATAVLVLKTLIKRGKVSISDEELSEGLYDTKWQGRMTKIYDNPLIFVDGAHNEAAWEMLVKTVNKCFTNRRIIYIIGVLRDKEYSKMIDILSSTMHHVIVITPNVARGLAASELIPLIEAKNISCEEAFSVKEAMDAAFKQAKEDDVVMICGSLSFISEYLNFFNISETS